MKRYWLVLTLWGAMAPLGATTWAPQSAEFYFENADVVARVKVVAGELVVGVHDGRQVQCGARLTAEVIDGLKGENERVTFFSESYPYSLGKEYFVFLRSPEKSDATPMMSTNSLAQERQALIGAACGNIDADFVDIWLATSKFVYRFSPEKREYEPWLTPAHNIAVPTDSDVQWMSIELHALRIDGKTIAKDHWSVSDHLPVPFELLYFEGAFEWESYRAHVVTRAKHAPVE